MEEGSWKRMEKLSIFVKTSQQERAWSPFTWFPCLYHGCWMSLNSISSDLPEMAELLQPHSPGFHSSSQVNYTLVAVWFLAMQLQADAAGDANATH